MDLWDGENLMSSLHILCGRDALTSLRQQCFGNGYPSTSFSGKEGF